MSTVPKNTNQKLGYTHLCIIFSYFTVKEISDLRKVCRLWYKAFQILANKITELPIHNLIDLYFFSFIVQKSQSLRELVVINHGDIPFRILLTLFETIFPQITSIQLLHKTDSESELTTIFSRMNNSLPNLQALTILGKILNEDDIYYIQKFQKLKSLNIQEGTFFEGRNLKELNPLSNIWLGGQNITFANIEPLLTKSLPILKTLRLDIEGYQEKDLDALTTLLRNAQLQSLELVYCNDFLGSHLVNLATNVELSKLVIHKACSIENSAYINFFKRDFNFLTHISFAMNDGFNDECLTQLAKACPNLRYLEIQWCEEVKNTGIYQLFVTCCKLEELNMVGLKHVNDKAFPLIGEVLGSLIDKKKIYDRSEHENIVRAFESIHPSYKDTKYYKSLRKIDTQKCDFISDEVLYLLKILVPECDVLNYYGETLHFAWQDRKDHNVY